MKKNMEFERVIQSESDAVWAVLAKLDGVEQWAPIIAECRVEGSGEGAVRHCVTADGGTLRERIVRLDEVGRAVHYTIEDGLPVDSYSGVFSVRERDGSAVVHWSVSFEGDEAAVQQVAGMLAEVAPAMLEGLDTNAAAAA